MPSMAWPPISWQDTPQPQERPTYQTKLPPDQEQAFQSWVAAKKVPFDPSPTADYDMRGYYQALQAKDPRAVTEVNAADKRMHFPDVWKTPYHATFSAESIYAPPDAPHWDGDVLIDKNGKVIADERPAAQKVKAK